MKLSILEDVVRGLRSGKPRDSLIKLCESSEFIQVNLKDPTVLALFEKCATLHILLLCLEDDLVNALQVFKRLVHCCESKELAVANKIAKSLYDRDFSAFFQLISVVDNCLDDDFKSVAKVLLQKIKEHQLRSLVSLYRENIPCSELARFIGFNSKEEAAGEFLAKGWELCKSNADTFGSQDEEIYLTPPDSLLLEPSCDYRVTPTFDDVHDSLEVLTQLSRKVNVNVSLIIDGLNDANDLESKAV